MKLFEITSKLGDMSGEEIIKLAIEKGLFKKELGRGTFAVAIELKSGDVLKAWAQDKAYEQYVEFCQHNKSNPFLIKVKSEIKLIKLNNKTLNYVRLEKLSPVKSLGDFGYKGSMSEKDQDYFFVKVQDHILDRLSGEDAPSLEVNDETLAHYDLDPKDCTPKFKKFIQAMFDIGVELADDGLDLDLKMANFGKRGAQIVFMDPVVDEQADIIELDINKVLK